MCLYTMLHTVCDFIYIYTYLYFPPTTSLSPRQRSRVPFVLSVVDQLLQACALCWCTTLCFVRGLFNLSECVEHKLCAHCSCLQRTEFRKAHETYRNKSRQLASLRSSVLNDISLEKINRM